MATATLGAEYDIELRKTVTNVLKALGARAGATSWGVGGSQEVSRAEFSVGGAKLVLEAETYVGFTITGPDHMVEDIADRVRRKLAE
jgi:hypothetical protein